MALRFTTLFIILFLQTNLFGQKVSNFLINGERFTLPGKWNANGQRVESGQFHFSNKKQELIFLISVREPEKFEFYEEDLSESQLLEKFYMWDYNHWNSPNGIAAEVSELKRNESKNYIIWKVIVKTMPENNNNDQPQYLLYAIRNNNLIGLQLANYTDKKILLSESDSIELLEKVYLKY